MSEDRQEGPESADFPFGQNVKLPEGDGFMNLSNVRINDEYDILDTTNRWCEGAVSLFSSSSLVFD